MCRTGATGLKSNASRPRGNTGQEPRGDTVRQSETGLEMDESL